MKLLWAEGFSPSGTTAVIVIFLPSFMKAKALPVKGFKRSKTSLPRRTQRGKEKGVRAGSVSDGSFRHSRVGGNPEIQAVKKIVPPSLTLPALKENCG